MGLDSFRTSNTDTGGQQKQQQQQDTSDDGEDSEPFKVVGSGAKRKVFPTEEDWEETVEHIEEELGMSAGEVLSMPSEKRHDVLHRAILGKNGLASTPFYPKRNCIVCNETFVYPNNWNFTEFKGEPVCNDHTLSETMDAYRQINTLEG